MGIKTVCEDTFGLLYRHALGTENPYADLNRSLENLENIVHTMRLFYYLTLVARELGVELPPEGEFEQNFRLLLREVLKRFHRLYAEEFPNLSEDDLVLAFTEGRNLSIGRVDPQVEDLIILLLGFLVDKTLSEVYTTTKIKNLVRELLGPDSL
ncbi:MAG: hypothetical protein GXO08_01370 [Aquificae bacterium]|nr:hypothetical protein [Aquificota bacterium]